MNQRIQSTHIRHQFGVNGSWDYTLTKTESSYNIDFGNGYRFQISPQLQGNKAITFLGTTYEDSFSQAVRDHLINNQITPMLKAWNGAIVFHASAVRYKNKIWGFMGNSGAGKSTLAKSLSSHSHIDHWCDDWLETENHEDGATSLYNSFSIRLESNHASNLQNENWLKTINDSVMSTGNKLLIQESQHQQNTTPTNLSHLCEVIPCSSLNEFSLERLKSSEAFRCVSQHLYRLDTTNTKHLQREFTELTKLVEKTPIYRMKFPHSLSDLRGVHKRIINTFCN